MRCSEKESSCCVLRLLKVVSIVAWKKAWWAPLFITFLISPCPVTTAYQVSMEIYGEFFESPSVQDKKIWHLRTIKAKTNWPLLKGDSWIVEIIVRVKSINVHSVLVIIERWLMKCECQLVYVVVDKRLKPIEMKGSHYYYTYRFYQLWQLRCMFSPKEICTLLQKTIGQPVQLPLLEMELFSLAS